MSLPKIQIYEEKNVYLYITIIMKNKIKIFLILIAILIVILGIYLSNKNRYNIYYKDYEDNNYSEIIFSDMQTQRYNDKLNNPTISYLVGNLDIILDDKENISNTGIIKYAMLFSENYDYRFESNSKKIDGKNFVKIKYLNRLIKELFNIKIDITKEDFNIIDDYVEMNIDETLITDVYTLALNKVLCDEKEDIYLAYIDFVSGNNSSYVLENEDDMSNISSTFVIRYKKNKNGINTILQYSKITK